MIRAVGNVQLAERTDSDGRRVVEFRASAGAVLETRLARARERLRVPAPIDLPDDVVGHIGNIGYARLAIVLIVNYTRRDAIVGSDRDTNRLPISSALRRAVFQAAAKDAPPRAGASANIRSDRLRVDRRPYEDLPNVIAGVR